MFIVGRVDVLTKHLKRYDRKLYCEKHSEGKLCVYRTSERWETFHLDDGAILHVSRPTPYFVLALTENWKANSPPRDWGIEPVMARIRSIDLWQRDIASDIEKNEEKIAASKEREQKNMIETQLIEDRSIIKKAFSDINTANMSKKEKRRKTKWEL